MRTSPNIHSAHSGDSDQYRSLRRKLSISLAVNWIIYTLIFCIIAFVLNFTMIPKIANEIADVTSEWNTWPYENFPLDRCLEILHVEALGIATNPYNDDHEEDEGDYESRTLTEESDTASNGQRIVEAPLVDDDGAPTNVYVHAEDNITILLISSVDESKVKPATRLLIRDGDLSSNKENPSYGITSFRTLQNDAIRSVIASEMGDADLSDIQIYEGLDGVMARDVTVYNFIKQFKIPVSICLYLIGCIVLIFVGYGKAMRYFAELSNAVGGLISNREKPIELSTALAKTESNLNAIRMASLADERAAKYAERRKDELVAYLAHDIKTPLTSVIGYLMLLEEAPDMPSEQRARYIGIASEKAQRLEALVDEFFEITRYNLQAIPIERSAISLRLLLEQVADEFYPDAQAKGISITIESDQEDSIRIDPEKFARALGNIIRNAIAYADPDSCITMCSRREEERWVVQVSDIGDEISEVHLQTIFEKFYREDSARTSNTGGAGLGLAIAKEIVVAHGGTISATSIDGKTTFTIELPV